MRTASSMSMKRPNYSPPSDGVESPLCIVSPQFSFLSAADTESLSAFSTSSTPATARSTFDDGGVKVFLRVRPLAAGERDAELAYRGDDTIALKQKREGKEVQYSFDRVFGPEVDQEEVFKVVGQPALDAVLRGSNACIFAYGQTGTGKTHTMLGHSSPGLIPRALTELFASLAIPGSSTVYTRTYTVEVSLIEIYCEKVRDMLSKGEKTGYKALKVRQHPSKGVFVEGVQKHVVEDAESGLKLLDSGMRCRRVATTALNDKSSRSHAIFTAAVTTEDVYEGGYTRTSSTSLSLVDLAGSERGTVKASATTREEATQINLSLTVLRKVIDALLLNAQGKKAVVPYRESTLTWILKDSLGGTGRRAMVAAISPSASSADETMTTLRYAMKARGISTVPTSTGPDPSAAVVRMLQEEIAMLHNQLLEVDVDALEAAMDEARLRAEAERERAVRVCEEVREEAELTRARAEKERVKREEVEKSLRDLALKLEGTEELLMKRESIREMLAKPRDPNPRGKCPRRNTYSQCPVYSPPVSQLVDLWDIRSAVPPPPPKEAHGCCATCSIM